MLDDQIKALAQRAGETTKILDTTLSASISTLNDHEARIQNALQKATADASTQTVTTPVNFTGTLTSGSVAVVTTSGSQSLSNKVLNGLRIGTSNFSASGTISASAPTAFVTTTAAVVLTLPPLLSATNIIVKAAVSGTPNITIKPATTGSIDGQTQIVLNTPYAWLWLQCSGTNWFITGKG